MIFEEMKNTEQKEAFLRKRREAVNSDVQETEKLTAYVLSDRFNADVQRLIDSDYYFDPPIQILLRKGQSDRKRKVYKFTEENKMLLQYLTFMLLERYDDSFPSSLYSFRKNNPTGKLFRTIRREDPHREKFIIKADIHLFLYHVAYYEKSLLPERTAGGGLYFRAPGKPHRPFPAKRLSAGC